MDSPFLAYAQLIVNGCVCETSVFLYLRTPGVLEVVPMKGTLALTDRCGDGSSIVLST